MSRESLMVLLSAAALSACQSMPSTEDVKAEVSTASQRWATAFNECNSSKAAALYDNAAVLWGTVSASIISSRAGVAQYFERVCTASPQPKVVFGEQNIRVYGDTALNSGTYTFTVFPAGQARQFPARYSFAYRKIEGQWLVVDHHSSALPMPPTAPAAPARQ
jgi:uncharacterized protein (TIGR02246 family)